MQPAASAGAVFQVESMKGAFQGVITTAGAGRHPHYPVGGPVRAPDAFVVGGGELRVGAVVARSAAITLARSDSSNIAMSSHSTAASRSTFASISSASRSR